jgi:hypothetical protein
MLDDNILLETRLEMVLLLLRILLNGSLRIICIIVGESRVSYVAMIYNTAVSL